MFAGSPAVAWLLGSLGDARRALPAPEQVLLGNVLGVLGVMALWRHRSAMDAPTRVLLVASTLVTFAFSSPLLRPEVLERLVLLAYVPGMIPLVYLLCREASAAVVVAPLALAMLLHGALAVKTLRQTALVPAAHEELAHFRAVLPPGRVIVIARPLLRWWVAWTMETRFSTRVEPALAARDRYDAVLVLDEIRGGVFGVAPGPARIGGLAAGVRDADLLGSEIVRTVAEGAYFRLSAVATAVSGLGGGARRPIEGVASTRARQASGDPARMPGESLFGRGLASDITSANGLVAGVEGMDNGDVRSRAARRRSGVAADDESGAGEGDRQQGKEAEHHDRTSQGTGSLRDSWVRADGAIERTVRGVRSDRGR